MSKIIKITVLLVLLFLAGGIITWHYLPTLLAKAITREDGGVMTAINVIPSPVKQSINQKVDGIPQALKALEAEGVYITIDDIIKIIDEAPVSDITKTIEVLERTQLQSTDQVISIVLDNMDFGKFENEKMIALAKQKMKMSDVKKAMKMIRENGKPYALTIPMGKETVKSILIEKKKKVEAHLNS